ncbi:unnamed protein product [Withania somnifera]
MVWLQILLFFLFINLSYSQTDTIFQGQHLRVGEKLESANKEFRLEHILQLPSNTTLFPDDHRPVWVANRDNPIRYASDNILTLDDEGKLKIFYERDSFILLSSYNATAKNASGTLFDNGNFVLVELNTNGSVNKTLRQSFDYPTDILLPGMKLGRNVKTGQIWLLTSWISEDVPASGSFMIGIDTNDIDQLIIWWLGSVFWTSGRWENGMFGNVFFISTEDEKCSVNETRTLSRYAIDPFGFIKERGAPGPFVVCFYKPSAGCVTAESIGCSIRNNSWFVRRFGNDNMGLFDCKRQCENNCSFAAFASITATGTGSEIWSNISILSSVNQSDGFILDAERGELPDGQEVATKRLQASSEQGLLEFKNEILLIAKPQHTNLVRLLGYCTQREERILVYEYMQNKSLDFFLFGNKKELLNWDTRFRIIEGIAQGLLYLHKYSRLKVIHRDLQSSNILLDVDMNPKISDFGIARIFGRQESEANTKRIVGTHGSRSLEYALRGIVSTNTDVFSFGVLLLEIVSGNENNSWHDSEHPLNLIGTGLQLSNVVSMLMNNTRQPPPPPQQPGFFIERGDQCAEISEAVRYSINGLSISELKAR